MGRPPIGKKPMTDAERQRRRRKRLAKESSSDVRRMRRGKAQSKSAERYMPAPPGITYWESREFLTETGPVTIRQPTTRPWAACSNMLSDDDIRALLHQVMTMAIDRGILPIELTAEQRAELRRVGLQRPPKPDGIQLGVSTSDLGMLLLDDTNGDQPGVRMKRAETR